MNIDAIKNGIVIDHIHAGGAMELYRLLNLDKLDCTVAIIKNAPSGLMGRKDIIKIDSMTYIDLTVIGYVDPGATWRPPRSTTRSATPPAGTTRPPSTANSPAAKRPPS